MSGWLVHPGGRPCVLKVCAQSVIIDVIMTHIINVIMILVNVIMILVNVMVRSPEWEV